LLIRYIAKRLLYLVPILIGVTFITFAVAQVIPGDPARMAAGPHARPEQVETIRKEYGLDKPWPVQYWRYLNRLARGDLGKSIQSFRPVAEDLREFFPATVELTVFAVILTVVVGVPLGVISAVRKGRSIDHLMRVMAMTGVSMPTFWLGLLLQLVFYRLLGWFPSGGRLDTFVTPPPAYTGLYLVDSLLARDWTAFGNALVHLVLPGVTLAYSSLAMMARMTRSSMLETLREDYIRTARAKGLAEAVVIYKHALRNALIPVVTVVGLQFGYLLAGTFMVETIFSWPGMGLYALRSVMSLDFPALMGAVLIATLVYVLINLLVDVTYALLNPQLRY